MHAGHGASSVLAIAAGMATACRAEARRARRSSWCFSWTRFSISRIRCSCCSSRSLMTSAVADATAVHAHRTRASALFCSAVALASSSIPWSTRTSASTSAWVSVASLSAPEDDGGGRTLGTLRSLRRRTRTCPHCMHTHPRSIKRQQHASSAAPPSDARTHSGKLNGSNTRLSCVDGSKGARDSKGAMGGRAGNGIEGGNTGGKGGD